MNQALALSPADAALASALTAFDEAALAQWKADGEQDCGSCGGAMLGYAKRSPLAKAMLAAGYGTDMGDAIYLTNSLPHPIRTQHGLVTQKAVRAFMLKAAEHGFEHKKHWTYVD